MGKYINEFTGYQLGQFDRCFKKVTRNKLMRFYSYLTYYFKQNGQIKMSIDDLTISWNNKYKKKADTDKCVCRATIYNWIKKLDLAELLKIKDGIDSSIYFLIDRKLDKNLDEKSCSKQSDSINVDSKMKYKYLSIKKIKDIDYNTTTVESQEHFNFNKYIEKCTYDFAMDSTVKVFDALRVRSGFIKNIVVQKVEKYYWNISKLGAVQYIGKLVVQAQQQCKNNFREISLCNSNNQVDSFNNYPQHKYDYNNLENRLLGWA